MTPRLLLPLLLVFSTGSHAAACPGGESYEKARAVVSDLQRIVTPAGVQQTYETTIGGIPQWINVRGQDRGCRSADRRGGLQLPLGDVAGAQHGSPQTTDEPRHQRPVFARVDSSCTRARGDPELGGGTFAGSTAGPAAAPPNHRGRPQRLCYLIGQPPP